MMTALARELDQGVIDVGGASVRWFAAGATSGPLPPVVLIHGTGGSTEGHFSFVFPMLARTQRVISVDLAPPPGNAELTVDDLERQVAAVVDREAPTGPVSVLGYSLGAVVAASYAAHHADRVQNLVLVAGWITTDTQQLLRQDVQQQLRGGDPVAFKKLSLLLAFGVPFLAKRSFDELATVAPPPSGTPEFLARLASLNRRIDIADEVAAIRAVTLVIGCTHDLMVPRHHSLALFGAIEDARYLELSSGHALVFERPAELHLAVRTFLSQPSRHPAGTVIPAEQP
ncbi:alpha/beta fold hydrolase [Herbiconiux daphne]|uniref:Alpha/beta hydrolase n=1 Tax=Herbiconiux daphne TaxID=2970914 RepID=A0ABT2H3K8_9MICO|nr:alpha/beta hydrolase [Herbiconiux daphne]MCS5734510.1 alpha/beta hydrolase [Herbiconiux daphne]